MYGYDYYGKSLYGADTAVQYSVEPVTATSVAPRHIQLAWGAASQNTWSVLRIVRNAFGVPTHGDDGTVIAEIPQSAPGRTWDDIGLPQGRVYYYGIFLGVTAWASTITYTTGDVVSYNGVNYAAVAGSIGITPGSSTEYWQHTTLTENWVRAGAAAGLSILDHGYALRLYESIPRAYRLDTTEVTGYEVGVTNPELFQFLSVFGHQLDTIATETGILRDLRRIDTAPSSAINSLAHQFGVSTEASDEPLRRRVHTHKAVALARSRGTDDGIANLINILTGWDVEIVGSGNLMLNQDQANWANPKFPAWDANLTYQGGEVVDHEGALWTAIKSVTTSTRADTMPVAASSGTVKKTPPSSGSTSGSTLVYGTTPFLVLSGTTNSYVTVNFTIAADGVYDLSVTATDGTAYGKTTYAIDGALSSIGTVDHYLSPIAGKPRTSPKTRYLGRYTLTAGTHTFTTKIVGKNAAATDDNAGFNYFVVTGTVDPSRGQEPVNGSGWWSKVTEATRIDVGDRLTNPTTLSPSTWSLRNLSTGAYPSGLSVAAGLTAVTGTDTDNNAATVTNQGTAAASLGVRSVGTPTARTWSADTTYVLDNLVRDTSGTVWRALVKNQDVEPGTDRNVWEVSDTQGITPLPMPTMVRHWGVPLNRIPQWSPQVSYIAGERVAFNNFAYVARVDSRNKQPDGDAADNTHWSFAGSAQQSWTASAYTKLLAGATSSLARPFIDWYDEQGNLVTTVNDGAVYSQTFFQRFNEPNSNFSGDRSYSTRWSSPSAWTTSGTWVVSDGMLSPVTPSSTPYTIWALNQMPGAAPIGDWRFYITFMSRPRRGSAAEHGIVFRSNSNATSFWMASRTRLTKTVSGTVTVMATWPEIPDGGRIYVNHASNLVEVYQYTAPGIAPKRLASISQTTPDGTYFGLLERSL
ncbi:phage tail protein [Streptomyces sp. RTd22]|uniref:phage tail protein n=1 Tax=Streptomyces sp. RTd22 TaxID=1841249 RepID=UPI001F43E757|nr:carbohydrate-binding protein [Streptomyces sp. RTd22]